MIGSQSLSHPALFSRSQQLLIPRCASTRLVISSIFAQPPVSILSTTSSFLPPLIKPSLMAATSFVDEAANAFFTVAGVPDLREVNCRLERNPNPRDIEGQKLLR